MVTPYVTVRVEVPTHEKLSKLRDEQGWKSLDYVIKRLLKKYEDEKNETE